MIERYCFPGGIRRVNELIGAYRWFFNLPVWLIMLAMNFLAVDILRRLREKLEGLDYNVSLSSEIGDRCLIAVIGIAATILQSKGSSAWPWWLCGWTLQLTIAAIAFSAVAVEAVQWVRGKVNPAVDRFHDMVILPGLCFLFLTALPPIFTQGNAVQITFAIVLPLVWAVLLYNDEVISGRGNGVKWLRAHGFGSHLHHQLDGDRWPNKPKK